jgi:EAL domain-containing protein (putative c-di-GMP-specific phosphodiesterase class I)
LRTAGMRVAIAEGVETEEQLALLRKLKCNHSQGFLHSRRWRRSSWSRCWRGR